VNSSGGFAPGDRVVIMQMKGATIDTTDSPAFGTLQSLGFAGHFEFATVDAVSVGSVRLRFRLVRQYDIADIVQLIRVASYSTDINVTGTVTGQKWNGIIGGVIVLETPGTLSINADIDASGLGFRGGDPSANASTPDVLGYKYAFDFRGNAAKKGESIAEYIPYAECGRGTQFSGGGGGNGQSGGGGGGANGGTGGLGGDQGSPPNTRIPNGGIGGRFVDYTTVTQRVFLGAGGGGGQQGDGLGTPGGAGGGIVIIRANAISSNGSMIRARGEKALTAGVDGAGGGGGGGTVLLAIGSAQNVINVDVSGGGGGDNAATDQFGRPLPDYCYAPGGGGGGGIVRIPVGVTNVNAVLTAGKAGIVTSTILPCYNTTYGAEDGTNGTTNSDVQLFEGTVPFEEPVLDQHDILICEGDTARLRVSGPALIVEWTPASNISNTASLTPDLYPTSTTTYTVSMQDSRGCIFDDSVKITVKPRPKPIVAGPDTACSLTMQGFTVSNISASSIKNWHVRGGQIVGDSTQDSVTVFWYDGFGGTVTFESSEDGSCVGVDSISVVVFPTRKVTLSGVHDMCIGDTLTVVAEPGYSKYIWSTGDTTDRIQIADSGTYYIEVLGGGPCIIRYDTFHVALRNPVQPQITASRDTITSPCQQVQLDAGAGYVVYQWSTGDTTRAIATLDSGKFIVTVMDSIGCVASDTIYIPRLDNGAARFTIKLDTLEAYPGEQVYYPVRVLSSENELLECTGDYQVHVHFNRSLLVPQQPYLFDRLEPRLRYVAFGSHFTGPNLNAAELPGITFVATLGDTIETPIIIDSFYWDNKVVDYLKYDGLFRLLGVCTDGDTRYVYTKGIQYMTAPRPNPASQTLQFEYSTLEHGYHEVILVDIMGRVMREILRGSVEPDQYKVTLDVHDLTPGQYFLFMRTPTTVFKQAVRINR
jgi:hypothetical protein